jgi:hypothetical protein
MNRFGGDMRRITFLAITVIALGFAACSNPTGSSTNQTTTTNHVYIVGVVGTTNGTTVSNTVSALWKDGTLTTLNGWWAAAIAQDTSGNTYILDDQNDNYGYWKNASTFTTLIANGDTTYYSGAIAVDSSFNIWAVFESQSSSNNYYYTENTGSIQTLSTSASVWDVEADSSGNVYFAGATGTGDSSDLPYLWKNGSTGIALSLDTSSGYTLGYASQLAKDSSGNLYVVGSEWGTSGSSYAIPVYWKYSGGAWGNPVHLSASGYSSTNLSPYCLALSPSGTMAVVGTTVSSGRQTGTLLYWTSASGNPIVMGTNGATYHQLQSQHPIAFDSSGNILAVGQTGNAYSASSGNITDGVPVEWVNGTWKELSLTSSSGTTYTWGRANQIIVGP